jgi:glycosyltransferase involved in cell wall biosynthesis
MKVGIVCDWYLPRIGGLELHLRDLGRELVKRGHEVHVVCVTPDETGETESEGVRIHRLAVPLVPRFATIRGPGAIRPLERLLRSLELDVIHTHNAFSPMAHVGALLARRMGVPSLFTECSVLRGPVGRGLRALNAVIPWGSWPTLLSGVSQFVADDVRHAARRDEVFVLHNGVDLQRWAVERREPERPRVTSVMRFTLRKRPTDMVQVIPEVHARLPPRLRPVFTLIGDGAQMPRVREEARRLGVAEHVELPGFLPRERIRDILGQSTLFALPTRKEAMSIASLEALAAGCPAVAMNLGGVSDVIEHGREGFLADDREQFVSAIVRLVEDHDLRHTMAAATTKRLARFSWDQVIARHLNLFRLAGQRVHGDGPELRLDPLGFEKAA